LLSAESCQGSGHIKIQGSFGRHERAIISCRAGTEELSFPNKLALRKKDFNQLARSCIVIHAKIKKEEE